VSQDVRDLIRKMSRENPLWGAPKIHGELLKLGIEIGETSVGKYMARHRKPPSQTLSDLLFERERSHQYQGYPYVAFADGCMIKAKGLPAGRHIIPEAT